MNFWDVVNYAIKAADYGARAYELGSTASNLYGKYGRAAKGETFSTAEKVETAAEAAFAAIGVAALGVEAGSSLKLFSKENMKDVHKAQAILWTALGVSSASRKACTVWKQYDPTQKGAWIKLTTQIIDISLQTACEALLYKYRLDDVTATSMTDQQRLLAERLSEMSQLAKSGLCENLARFLIWGQGRFFSSTTKPKGELRGGAASSCSSLSHSGPKIHTLDSLKKQEAVSGASSKPSPCLSSHSGSKIHTLDSLKKQEAVSGASSKPSPCSSSHSGSKIHTLDSLRQQEVEEALPLDPLSMALKDFNVEEQDNLKELLNAFEPLRLKILCRELDRQIPDAFKDLEVFENFIDPITGRAIRFPVGFDDSAVIYEKETLLAWIKANPGQQVPKDHKPHREMIEVKVNGPLLKLISDECNKLKHSLEKVASLLQEV